MSTATQGESARNGQVASQTAVDSILESVDERTRDWSQFRKRFAERKKLPPLRKRLTPHALCWGLTEEDLTGMPLLDSLFNLKKQKASDCRWNDEASHWLSSVEPAEVEPNAALLAIAWCHALPQLVNRLQPEQWRDVCRRLIRLASTPSDATNPFVRLLLVGELPMTLPYVLRAISDFAAPLDAGRKSIAAILDEVLDGEGMPHARHLDQIQPLLAGCVRCLVMDAELKKGKISRPARLQFDWLVRQTLRWSRSDGSTTLRGNSPSPYFDELMKAALALTDDKSDLAAYKMLRGKRKSPTNVRELPEPSEHSEWSELATLRTDWSPVQSRLAVDFSSRKLNIELSANEQILCIGNSLPSIVVDDQPLQLTSGWEEVCWESDADMDYIELEAQLTDQWKIQRQMLLARPDNFAYVADAIIGPTAGVIQYDHAIPLADAVSPDQSNENTEVHLLAPKRAATVVPLSLSEWKSDTRDGQLRTTPLTLSLRHRGTTLYAPLFIDLDKGRRRKALTWRRLTVGQDLQIVPQDVAVAYRVQIGKQQWVFYRSLAPAGNRTFIGINLISEFLAARFDTDGEIEPLIDIAG